MSITVTATSNPPEAKVTGGGRPLGVTPLTTQVPIPALAPGQPAPSFDFLFEKEGYESATIQASPVNGMINITAALAPSTPATPETGTPTGPGDATHELEVAGTGGGSITDFHTTTATATVAESCVIDALTAVLRGNHSYHQDLVVTLRSPAGQTFTLHNKAAGSPFRRHRVRNAAGDQAQGEWTLRVRDDVERDTGRLTRFALELECR